LAASSGNLQVSIGVVGRQPISLPELQCRVGAEAWPLAGLELELADPTLLGPGGVVGGHENTGRWLATAGLAAGLRLLVRAPGGHLDRGLMRDPELGYQLPIGPRVELLAALMGDGFEAHEAAAFVYQRMFGQCQVDEVVEACKQATGRLRSSLR
jgi:hypothetical protein